MRRGSAAAVLVALTLAIAVGCTRAQGQRQLKGKLVFVDYHDGEDNGDWALYDDEGGRSRYQPLGKGKKPPRKDKNGEEVQVGQLMTLACTADPTTGQCTSVASADVTLLSPAVVPPASRTTQRLLVILVDAPACGSPAGTTPAALSAAYLGPALDGKSGIAMHAEQCSYGELMIDPAAFTVVTVTPACAWATTACDAYAIAGAAQTAAQAKLGATAYSSFTNFHIVLAAPSACGWSGLATTGGNLVWLNTVKLTPFPGWYVPMQEICHNFILFHGYRNGYEYQDVSSYMGSGTACPSAPELALLGWATPITSGSALDATTLPVGKAIRFLLPATHLTGMGNHIRIRPTWLPAYSTTAAKNIYMAVRAAAGGDGSMSAGYANMLHIHDLNATMDNNLATWRGKNRKVNFIAGVPANTRTIVQIPFGASYNLVVYTAATWSGSSKAFLGIWVCRYVSVNTECPTLAAVQSGLSPPPKANPGLRNPPMPPFPPEVPEGTPRRPPTAKPTPSKRSPPRRSAPPPRRSAPPPRRSPPNRKPPHRKRAAV